MGKYLVLIVEHESEVYHVNIYIYITNVNTLNCPHS